jgi:hypothetical protein
VWTVGQLLVLAGAFVRKSGRVFYRLAHLCGGSGDFSHRGKHLDRRPAGFLCRRPRSCGGPTAFCTGGCIRAKPRAGLRTGSRHFAEGRMASATGARQLCAYPAGFRTLVCTGAPAGTDLYTGLCSLRPALRDAASIHARSHLTLQKLVLAGARNDSSLGRSSSRLARDLCAFTNIAGGDARRVFELKRWTGPLHGFVREGGGRERRPAPCSRQAKSSPGRCRGFGAGSCPAPPGAIHFPSSSMDVTRNPLSSGQPLGVRSLSATRKPTRG